MQQPKSNPRFLAWYPVFSAFILFAAFPPLGLGLLALIGLVPLYIALRSATPKQGFRIGFVFGFVFWALIWFWLIGFVNEWTRSPLLGLAPWLLMALLLGLYSGVFGLISAMALQRTRWPAWLVLPAAWVVVFEFARSYWPLGGLPWALLGTAFYNYPALIQPASVGGVWLLSFVAAMVNAVIAFHKDLNRVAWGAMVFLFVLGGLHSLVLSRWELMDRNETNLQIALLQTGVDQAGRSTQVGELNKLSLMRQKLESLPPAPAETARLAIFPESVLTIDPETAVAQSGDTVAHLLAHANRSGSFLLFGAHQDRAGKAFNTAYLMNPDGTVADRYAKVNLVPFGEYVPFRERLPFVSMFGVLPFDVTPGEKFHTLESNRVLPGSTREHPEWLTVGTPICFESFYPNISREMARQGADLIALLVNDDWYGMTTRWQHAMVAPIRAVETRLPVIRSTPTGVSMVVGPDGRYETLPVGEQTLKITEISHSRHPMPTLYVRFGDWVVWLAVALLVGAVAIGRKPKVNGEP